MLKSNQMKRKIIVIGSINQDLVVKMEKIPEPGETLFGETLHYFPGGKGANQAIAAKLLGGDVTFYGKVGRDLFGANLTEYLSNLNLGTYVQTVTSSSTGTAIITIDKNGENAISVISGANMTFKYEDLDIFETFQKDDILLMQNEINNEIVFDSIVKAKAKDMLVIYNPAPAISIPERIISLCDFIIVNEHELEISFNLKALDFNNKEELVQILLNITTKYDIGIVLTLGSKGCVGIKSGKIFETTGKKVNVIDTTGAGDCFCGAFVSAISQGNSLSDSLEFANFAASLSVSKLGASVSFPKLNEMHAFRDSI